MRTSVNLKLRAVEQFLKLTGFAALAVLAELPALSRRADSKWSILSMEWNESSQSYEFSVSSEGSDKWVVIFDARHTRILKFERQ